MSVRIEKLLKENKGFILFIALMAVFRGSIADWNSVPTGSMQPTIVEGDRILVNKLAYDLHLPFSRLSLWRHSHPKRGDIVVFDSEAAGKRLVKRVIGLPGDLVAMRNNRLSINGQALGYSTIAAHGPTPFKDRQEDLAGMVHSIRIHTGDNSRLSSFAAVEVPPDHYLVLGDNRDNSADSRIHGFIPRDEIVGRSRQVIMSLNYDNYYLPRSERFFHDLMGKQEP